MQVAGDGPGAGHLDQPRLDLGTDRHCEWAPRVEMAATRPLDGVRDVPGQGRLDGLAPGGQARRRPDESLGVWMQRLGEDSGGRGGLDYPAQGQDGGGRGGFAWYRQGRG